MKSCPNSCLSVPCCEKAVLTAVLCLSTANQLGEGGIELVQDSMEALGKLDNLASLRCAIYCCENRNKPVSCCFSFIVAIGIEGGVECAGVCSQDSGGGQVMVFSLLCGAWLLFCSQTAASVGIQISDVHRRKWRRLGRSLGRLFGLKQSVGKTLMRGFCLGAVCWNRP